MNKAVKLVAGIVLGLTALGVLGFALLHGHNIAVLNPKGPVARQEFGLLILATLLMLVIVLPVFALTIAIAWKYRAGNSRATYLPDWDHNHKLEIVWWGFPCVIILALGFVTWISSHTLDPYKPLSNTNKAITIQVVALDWKWLFIYPQQNIATVNYVELPVNTPVNFEITSDAPMNSFWIPQLGSQIYAMPGMSTQLHLMADTLGNYRGESANISGVGFAGMTFTAHAVSATDFASWVHASQAAPRTLTQSAYNQLARPSQNVAPATYATPAAGLYDGVVMKYMPAGASMQNMIGMNMP